MKKWVVAAGMTVISCGAFAEGGSLASPSSTFAYATVNSGIANKHLNSVLASGDPLPPGAPDHAVSRANEVLTLGGSIGYQFLNHLALEFGGNWLASARINDQASEKTRSLDSWVGYLAAKMSVPVYNNLNLYGKAGLGYQYMSGSYFNYAQQSADSTVNLKHAAWVPVFAVGANYDINRSIFAGLQYMRYGSSMRSNNSGDSWVFTAKDLLTASLGYKFQM